MLIRGSSWFSVREITAEQLCWKSSRNWLFFDIPEFVFTNHGIDDGKKFSHTGDDGHFLKFIPVDEPLIESLDHRVRTNSREGRHVKLGAYLGTAAPDVTSATLLSTVTIERSHSGQLGDLVPVKLAQLRTFGKQ